MIIRKTLPVPIPTFAKTRRLRVIDNTVATEATQRFAPIAPISETAIGMGRSFSAQLLELGMTHNVKGLIRKAENNLSGYDDSHKRITPYGHYESAQNNFSEPHVLIARLI